MAETADPEHLEILMRGAEAWNKWRDDSEFPHEFPALKGANLSGARLSKVDLSVATLSNADLRGADLSYANMAFARLDNVNFDGAQLQHINFRVADLRNSSLRGAKLDWAVFGIAKLEGADFSNASLHGTEFVDTNLRGADFSNAKFGTTLLARSTLSEVRGLDTCTHDTPSIIDPVTFAKSGVLPVKFLQGCGVPDDFIDYMRALTAKPIEFYSCFISYSSKDQDFADRLHTDLQARGVRVWFAPHDMPIGARIRPTIDESIRVYDKLLLVLSEHSVSSQWVEQEVETALAREREPEGKTVLFPVRIDDAIMQINAGWPAYLRNTRNVGDFTRWKEHDSYQKAFERLLRDLKAEA